MYLLTYLLVDTDKIIECGKCADFCEIVCDDFTFVHVELKACLWEWLYGCCDISLNSVQISWQGEVVHKAYFD